MDFLERRPQSQSENQSESRSHRKHRAWVGWSSGKDAAFALHIARTLGELEVAGVLTTVTDTFSRVSMHGVRESLLDAQIEALGLPGIKVRIPYPCPNEVYERAMAQAMDSAKAQGITHMIFGDLYLQDIREYRESKLRDVGIQPVFPLWQRDTRQLATEMLKAGVQAHVVCLDPRRVDRRLAGSIFNSHFLEKLGPDVDPCGENGEFHTFVSRGPMFRHPIDVRTGEVVERDNFVFADLMPA